MGIDAMINVPHVDFHGETEDVLPIEPAHTPSFTIVTSFNKFLWNNYAKTCFESWLKNFPSWVRFKVWLDGEWPLGLPNDPRVEYLQLDTQEFFMEFAFKYQHVSRPDMEKIPRNHWFRWNFMPFWCKVFAMTQELNDVPNDGDYLLWLDADVFVNEPVDVREWMFWTSVNETNEKFDILWLARGAPWNYGETGWVLFKLTETVREFAGDLRATYMSGALFDYSEWHDAFVISSLFKKYSSIIPIGSINGDPSALYPFESSPLHPNLIHYKGPRKVQLGGKPSGSTEGEPESPIEPTKKPVRKIESVLDGIS